MVKIWLDDLRQMPLDYTVCAKTYDEAIFYIQWFTNKNEDIFISFDHDLGQDKSGYDVCKYIVENRIDLYGFSIHSMNPVGVQNMRQLMSHYGYKEMSNQIGYKN